MADELTRLFQAKVELHRKLVNARARNANGIGALLERPGLLDYLEATRTLEARLLLQLVDSDAREVARSTGASATALEEINAHAAPILEAIVELRRRIGAILHRNGDAVPR
jgi:hypothetical protein